MSGSVSNSESLSIADAGIRLFELGYCDKPFTDDTLPEAVVAIGNFQTANGLEKTGIADFRTLDVLFDDDAVSLRAFLEDLVIDYENANVLEMGAFGDPVVRMQSRLMELGYLYTSENGSFGEETRLAVCRFQMANGMEITGEVDEATLLRMYNGKPVDWADFLTDGSCSLGDCGWKVRMLQQWLECMGLFHGRCSGEYGDRTADAVAKYQKKNGLEPTGNMDRVTAVLFYPEAAKWMLEHRGAVGRGDEGSGADEVCAKLRQLGYEAHDTFDYQTELELMRCQLQCGMEPTGWVSLDFRSILRQLNEVNSPIYIYLNTRTDVPEAVLEDTGRTALEMVGQPVCFDDSYSFVEYCFLKNNVILATQSRLGMREYSAGDPVTGNILCVMNRSNSVWGIAVSDTECAFMRDDGYVVLCPMENAERIWVAVTE